MMHLRSVIRDLALVCLAVAVGIEVWMAHKRRMRVVPESGRACVFPDSPLRSVAPEGPD